MSKVNALLSFRVFDTFHGSFLPLIYDTYLYKFVFLGTGKALRCNIPFLYINYNGTFGTLLKDYFLIYRYNMVDKNEKNNGCFHFSITYHFDLDTKVDFMISVKDDFIKSLKLIGVDKFVFQGEICPTTGRHHFQGYFHIKIKKRVTQLNKLFRFLDKGAGIKTSSAAGINALKTYCMKDATRVCGPWADKPIYLGEDLPSKLLGWQDSLKNYILGPVNPREIIYVYDEFGMGGKSIFAKYMCYYYSCIKLTYGKQGDLLNLVSKNQNKQCYIFDLSRTKPSTFSNEDLYSSIEDIKNGHFINTKYETESVIMRIPHIIVFANHLPRTDRMSEDRWNILRLGIDANPYRGKKFVKFNSRFFKSMDVNCISDDLDQ